MAVESTASTALSAPVTSPSPHVVDGMAQGPLSLPFGDMALRADFDRQGPDLVIEGLDGTQVVIQDYFATTEPSDLVLGDGAGVLKGALVSALAGSPTAGQYAQAETASVTDGAIGQVEAATGEAFAIRADGTQVALEVGSPIYMGDVLQTPSDGAIAVLFTDGTRFSLSEDARMVVDELIYDPGSDSNVASFSLVQGLFVLVSGDVVKTGDMTVETPVATIGIRGTSAAIQAAAEGLQNLVTLLQDPDGNVGLVEVATEIGTVILSEVGATTTVTSLDQAPTPVEILGGADIEALYRAALATMQLLSEANLGVGDSVINESSNTNANAPSDEGAASTLTVADVTENGNPGDDESQAGEPADPNAAVQAFAEAVGDLFEALAEEIEENETANAESDATDDPTPTGASAGDEIPGVTPPADESLPDKARSDPPVETDPVVETDQAPTDPDVVVVGGADAFLRGTFLELGVSANGALGTDSAPPDGFASADQLNRPNLSFYGDDDPLAGDDATTGDAFLPGIPVENFTIAFTDGAGAFVGSNQGGGLGTDIAMGLSDTASGGGVNSVTSAGGVDGRLDVSQTISLGLNDTFFTTTVTLTNSGDGTITGLRYMRSGDPDQDADGGGTFRTVNDVLMNPDENGIAAVDAQGPTSDQSILLLADQGALNAANGLDDGSIAVRASAFGFLNLNPFNPNAFDNPADPNGRAGDIAINLVYDLPDLEPGESVTISWVTSLNAPSDGNDVLAVRGDEVAADGGDGDDIIYATRDDTVESLEGGDGNDQLFAMSEGDNGDALNGGDGNDVLFSSGGDDFMTGGEGNDRFVYDNVDDGFAVAGNTAFSNLNSPAPDVIVDFESGADTVAFLSSAFGGLPIGNLQNGVNFSVINDSYDGTNAGANVNHGLGQGSFIYSLADGVLHYDGNGATDGYTAVAAMDQPAASDIEIVATV
ncbi:MAG: FecR domain-containing protein [Pseudomonadota bacterium]